VVGDEVELEPTGEGEAVITGVLPRRTKLSRVKPREPHIEHVIAANVDRLLIVSSVVRPPLTIGIIDRYVIAAETGGLEPMLAINKTDLATEPAQYEDVARLYRELGLFVACTSAKTGAGIDGLKAKLTGSVTVLAGHSGVGKSSLINAVQPGLKLKTGEVKWKGQHVTSNVTLLKLDPGGYVVDTPGIRELSPWDIEKRDVAQFFPHIWEFSRDCKMPDCSHIHEPGCAVKAALELGEIPSVRYKSYVGIVESIRDWMAPRETDVDRPDEQVRKSQRRASRRTLKQRLKRGWQEEPDSSQ